MGLLWSYLPRNDRKVVVIELSVQQLNTSITKSKIETFRLIVFWAEFHIKNFTFLKIC